MTWLGRSGTGTPQSKVVRLTDRSFRPERTKLATSFIRVSGLRKSGCSA